MAISKRTRFLIFQRDNFQCQICGREASKGARLEVDHKLARANGGSDERTNLWILCFDCNSGKSYLYLHEPLPPSIRKPRPTGEDFQLKDYATSKEAAAYLGIRRPRLYKYISDGRLKVYRRKDNLKLSYFSRAELDTIKSGFNEFILAEDLDPKRTPVAA